MSPLLAGLRLLTVLRKNRFPNLETDASTPGQPPPDLGSRFSQLEVGDGPPDVAPPPPDNWVARPAVPHPRPDGSSLGEASNTMPPPNPHIARYHDGSVMKFANGGYPVFHVTEKGHALCHECTATNDDEDSGDKVIDHGVNWEDPDLYCEMCSTRIESAYAEPEEGDGEEEADEDED